MQTSLSQDAFGNEDVPQLVTELKGITERFVRFAGVRIGETPPIRGVQRSDRPLLSYLEITKLLIEDRKKREADFSADLFADPVWDTLLALFSAQLEGKPVSITSACLAAKVPMTTALRYISLMERNGLIIRKAAPFDKRSLHILLTDSASDHLMSYIENVARRWSIEIVDLDHHAMKFKFSFNP